MSDLEDVEKQALHDLANADSAQAVEDLRVRILGKKGWLTKKMRELGQMSDEERQKAGPELNLLKERLGAAIAERKEELHRTTVEKKLAEEKVDVTLPVEVPGQGRIHPVSHVSDQIAEIFADMGFSIAEGPDIEDDFYNFTALNIPPEHPARQMHDTFYLPETDKDGHRKVLRTHTSPVQIRTMESQPPPIRVIVPGRTYRCDSDQTHTPMFHQVEGLVIDEDTHMGHLKGCLESFCKAFFEIDAVKMRFRPSYFPFTEPSAEVDIGCSREGDEIKIGEGDDWLEILGCGMVHPRVLEAVNLDPGKYQGFAFGMGIDRLAMLKYGMPDLRAFFDSDLRWLKHYGFAALDVPTLAGGLSR